MPISLELLQMIHSYIDTHSPSNIDNILSGVSISDIVKGKSLYLTIHPGEYEIFSINASGFVIYALYKYKGAIYCIGTSLNANGYLIHGYCMIENVTVFDDYI